MLALRGIVSGASPWSFKLRDLEFSKRLGVYSAALHYQLIAYAYTFEDLRISRLVPG